MYKQIKILIAKELHTDWRQRSALSAIVIYVVSTVFISYLSFRKSVNAPTWNALFWINIIFAGINAVAKSFMAESKGFQLYAYITLKPTAVILAKIVYNLLLMLVLSLITLFFYCLFMGSFIQNTPLFIITVALGSMGFAGILTMASAIAAKASQNTTLMAILSFPILIPLLLTVIKLSKYAIDGLPWSICYPYVLILLALNMLIIALAYILFPYLWRE